MSATTARTLIWAAGILALLGAMIGAPGGAVLVLAMAALLAAAPALFHRGRARWAGAILALAAVALGAARLPEARRELDRYTSHARK
jgi:hypothetical protein